MRLLQYTIIIWMGCAHPGEPLKPAIVEPIHPTIDPIHVIPKPYPIDPIRLPVIEPIHPIGEPIHTDPILHEGPIKKPTIYPDPIHGTGLPSVDPTGGFHGTSDPQLPHEPPVSQLVKTYLSQHGQFPEALQNVDLPKTFDATVKQIRVQYLEQMLNDFDPKQLITMPKIVMSTGSFIEKGVGPSLIEWVVSITDGLSFAEHLSQLPTATKAQKQQFLFLLSPEKKLAYETAKTGLVDSAQKILKIIASLHEQDQQLFFMGKRSSKEMVGLSAQIDQVQLVLESSMAQRRALVTFLSKESPLYDEAMLAAVIDPAPGLEAWKGQEQISKQSATVLFPSYEAFMNGYLTTTNVKEYVQTCMEKGQFPSVQALVTVLDKIGFILESKNFWLSFRNKKYSKKTIDTILDSLLKEYPEAYIPSKKYILRYCKLHRIFKPVSFFIPQYEQFLIDTKTLTIDELARKYGQEPEFIKSLLNNTYEAVYVLQQTNQNKQAGALNEVVKRILLEYPEMTPEVVAQVIASEEMPIRTVFDAEARLTQMAMELKNELVALQTRQFQTKLASVSSDLTRAETFVSQSLLRAQLALTSVAADTVSSSVKGARLDKVLTEVLKELQQAESSFNAVSASKKSLSPTVTAQYQDVSDQLTVLKQDAMQFGLQVEYERVKAQQNKLSSRLLDILQAALKEELLSSSQTSVTNALLDIMTSLKSDSLTTESPTEGDGGSNEISTLIDQIVEKSVSSEQENEKDYQACIWASNKMGMMENKIMYITTLLKIKKTPLFLAGYKSALKDLDADFVFLSTSKSVEKCFNVIAERSFLAQKLKDLEGEIKDLEQKINTEQKTRSGLRLSE